jgi:hypothetical protein
MKAFSRLLIAAIGAAAFASCTQNGGLIYMNIQKTQKTNTSTSIPLDITVSEIASTYPTDPTAPYYVAAGKIYNGSTPVNGTTTWGSIPVPQVNGKDMLCNAMTWDGTNIWGGFFSSDGSSFGLYKMTPPATSASSWSQVNDPYASMNDTQFTYLMAVGGGVFVVTATLSSGASSFAYELDLWDGSAWHQLVPQGVLSRPITGIGFDGTKYYFTSGNSLYVSSGVFPTSLTFSGSLITATDGSNSNGDILQGVFVDLTYQGTANPIIIVPASNPQVNPPAGNLYYSTDAGTTWTRVSQQIGGYNVGFLCVSGAVDTGHTTYLLGTDSGTGGAFGFYSFVPSTNSLNRFGGLSYSLYYSAVRRILVDITNNFVAMGTINNGLWATTPVDPSGGFGSNTWTQE